MTGIKLAVMCNGQASAAREASVGRVPAPAEPGKNTRARSKLRAYSSMLVTRVMAPDRFDDDPHDLKVAEGHTRHFATIEPRCE